MSGKQIQDDTLNKLRDAHIRLVGIRAGLHLGVVVITAAHMVVLYDDVQIGNGLVFLAVMLGTMLLGLRDGRSERAWITATSLLGFLFFTIRSMPGFAGDMHGENGISETEFACCVIMASLFLVLLLVMTLIDLMERKRLRIKVIC